MKDHISHYVFPQPQNWDFPGIEIQRFQAYLKRSKYNGPMKCNQFGGKSNPLQTAKDLNISLKFTFTGNVGDDPVIHIQ